MSPNAQLVHQPSIATPASLARSRKLMLASVLKAASSLAGRSRGGRAVPPFVVMEGGDLFQPRYTVSPQTASSRQTVAWLKNRLRRFTVALGKVCVGVM